MPELPEPMTLATTDESTLELPQIDPQVAPNVGEYSEQAGLADGDTAVVTLTVDVGADGAVISAQVIKSNGGEVANEAAVAYARATRWIPGKVDGVPRAMQASLTVILGERA
jgi:TonB family protein